MLGYARTFSGGDILVLHDEIDNIERHLQSCLNCHAVIHLDPVVTNDRQISDTKQAVKKVLSAIDPDLTMHDFRMVTGPSHTNVIFDVVIPFGYPLSDEALTEQICASVRKMDGNYFAVVTVDKAYA